MLALTGPIENVAQVSKSFRIYVSSIPKDEPDYLVDHSICFYLMDTNGEILDYYGQNMTSSQIILKLVSEITKDQAALARNEKTQKP